MAAWNGSRWRPIGKKQPPFYSYPACLIEYDGRLVAGGSIATFSDSASTSCVQAWDGVDWQPVGYLGGDSILATVAVLKPVGHDLIAAGRFSIADGQEAFSIARWNGTRWTPIGQDQLRGEHAVCWDIEEYLDQLYVCGRFALEDSVATGNVMRWDGMHWSLVGGGTDGDAMDMLVHEEKLFVAGRFEHAGGIETGPLAAWDGSTWTPVPAGFTRDSGLALFALEHDGEELFVAGNMDSVAGELAPGLARFDGTRWSRFDLDDPALEPDSEVSTLVKYAGGLVALGNLRVPGERWSTLRWDGTRWRRLGSEEFELLDWAQALAPTSHAIVAAGPFRVEGSVRAEQRIAAWDGQRWSALGEPIDGIIRALVEHNDRLYAGGAFTRIGDLEIANIAEWDGKSWYGLGSGIDGGVRTLEVFRNRIIAGGDFEVAGGRPADAIAAWDGREWNSLGGGVHAGPVTDLTIYDGDLVACGAFRFAGQELAHGIARWNGAAWGAIHQGLVPPPSYVSHVVTWQGQLAIAVDSFTDHRYITVGDGLSWRAIPTPHPYNVTELGAYRDWLVVGGTFYTDQSWEPSYALLWDGSEWLRMGSGPQSTPESRFGPEITAMTTWQGSLFLGGRMLYAGSQRTQGLAAWAGAAYAVAPPLNALQVGPNPARSTLLLSWTQSGPGDAVFSVFDVRGRRLAQVPLGFRPGGRQSHTWNLLDSDGQRVATGIYFVRLETEGSQSARKVAVVR